jgi:hypothetical protein
MSKKSTDPGLSAAERKTLRGYEAQEAISDHKAARALSLHSDLHAARFFQLQCLQSCG